MLPMDTMLARGIRKYIDAEKPRTWLFEGNEGNEYSQRGAQWAISQAVRKAGIVKEVAAHTSTHLRYPSFKTRGKHSYHKRTLNIRFYLFY